MENYKIDLKQGWGEIEGKCPTCKENLKVEGLPRWNININCPNCKNPLLIDFDFIVLDDGDEWDFYDIKNL
jgi:hypothetical protein